MSEPIAVDKPTLPLPRLMRAPLVISGFIFSVYVLAAFLGTVTFGAWAEEVFRLVGIKRVGLLASLSGVVLFVLLCAALPARGGYLLIGWPGLIVGPALAVLLLSRIARW